MRKIGPPFIASFFLWIAYYTDSSGYGANGGDVLIPPLPGGPQSNGNWHGYILGPFYKSSKPTEALIAFAN